MPRHPLDTQITHAVELLRERGVLDGVLCPCVASGGEVCRNCSTGTATVIHGAGCINCHGETTVAHPLRPLLVAQDAYEQEAGLCVPCPEDPEGVVPRHWSKCHGDCHGSGYVPRTLDGWPEPAIVGWVKWLVREVGWHLSTDRGSRWGAVMWYENRVAIEGTMVDGDTEAAAALSALCKAIEKEVVG